MKVSRRSWHMRLGQKWWAEGKVPLLRPWAQWVFPWRKDEHEGEERYEPSTLCSHIATLTLAVPTLMVIIALLCVLFTPSRCLIAALPRLKGVSDPLSRLLAAAHRNACPLIEVED